MFQLDLKSKKSIYEQIVDGFKNLIIDGALKPGDRIPSVRDMSAKLTVNPNTIQKAYRRLEDEGWIYTISGRGAFVSEAGHEPDREQIEAVYEQIGELVSRLAYLGETKQQTAARLAQLTEERGQQSDSSH